MKYLQNLHTERLIRVHGGAVAKSGMKPFKELKERNKEFRKQKNALSLKAAEFISDGDIVGIEYIRPGKLFWRWENGKIGN